MKISPLAKMWCLIFALIGLGLIAHYLYNTDQNSKNHWVPSSFVTPIPKHIALNPAVTQDTIQDTICRVGGYTRSVRPTSEYTRQVKLKELADRGEPASDAKLYELDHWIPLTLGGAPSDVNNLVLQPWPEAKQKDKDEFKLGKCVCAGGLTLYDAQTLMSTWKHLLPESTYANCPNIPEGYHK